MARSASPQSVRDARVSGERGERVLLLTRDFVVVDKPCDVRMDGAFPVTVETLLPHWLQQMARQGLPWTEIETPQETTPAVAAQSAQEEGADEKEQTRRRAQAYRAPQPDGRFRWVHQLDYATSGVLCVARHKPAARHAAECFTVRSAKKVYSALLYGHVRVDGLPFHADGLLARTEQQEEDDRGRGTRRQRVKRRQREEEMLYGTASSTSAAPAPVASGSEVPEPRSDIEVGVPRVYRPLGDAAAQRVQRVRSNLGMPPLVLRESGEASATAGAEMKGEASGDIGGESGRQGRRHEQPQRGDLSELIVVNAPIADDPSHDFRMCIGGTGPNADNPGRASYTIMHVVQRGYLSRPGGPRDESTGARATAETEDEKYVEAAAATTESEEEQEAEEVEAENGDENGDTEGRATNGRFPVTHVLMYPQTGRRHQLRLHAQLMGHPIVGDCTYATGMPGAVAVDQSPRMMLHSLGLYLPLAPKERTHLLYDEVSVYSPDPFEAMLPRV